MLNNYSKSIINKFYNTLHNNIEIFIFFLSILIKMLIFGKQIETGYFSFMRLFPSVFASILILVSISILFNKKRRINFLYTIDIIVTILIIGDLNYFRYFKDMLSVPVLKNGFQLGAVGSSIASLFKFQDLFYIIDLIFIKKLVNYFNTQNIKQFKLSNKIYAFLTTLILGCTINFISIYKLSIDQPRLISTLFNRIYVTKQLGIINYHCIDAYNSLAVNFERSKPLSAEKQNEVITLLQTKTDTSSKLKGSLKDKNLIVIQVEALQSFVINNTVNGKEITPNLNKFLKNSVYFNNYFYQIGDGGTSDAEFVSNNSLFPAPSGSVYYLYSNNEFNSLPKALKEEGYETAAFHGYRDTFWNRNVMYKAQGFDKFYGERSFNIDEEIGLGLSDKSFFNQSLDKLKTLKKPYYSFMITLSSHYPFDAVNKYGDFDTGTYNNTLFGNYLKSIHYTDEQLGLFLESLEREGLMKDSLIVIYGDHYAIPRNSSKELAHFLNLNEFTDLQWSMIQKVPLIMHFPDETQKGTVENYCGQIDLYPTIANLFSLPNENMLGRDLFNSKENSVIFKNGSFIFDEMFYAAQSNSYYNINTSEKINEDDKLKNFKNKQINTLNCSDNILKYNLLKNPNVKK